MSRSVDTANLTAADYELMERVQRRRGRPLSFGYGDDDNRASQLVSNGLLHREFRPSGPDRYWLSTDGDSVLRARNAERRARSAAHALRDRLAEAAMPHIIGQLIAKAPFTVVDHQVADAIAIGAYRIADAMLGRRGKEAE